MMEMQVCPKRWSQRVLSRPSHLTEVLGVVLSGHKHHRLVLGPHHIAQQVEKHGGLGVLPREKEGGLRGEGPRGLALQAGGGAEPGAGRSLRRGVDEAAP